MSPEAHQIMPIDDSFLRKEAAKRRFMTIMLALLLANFATIAVIYLTGFFRSEPTISRVIIYSEVVVLIVLYFVFKRRFDKKSSS